jgi:hypothetical protein
MFASKFMFKSVRKEQGMIILLSVILTILSFVTSVDGQSNANFRPVPHWMGGTSPQQGRFFFSGSPAYREEVSRLLLQEANRVARELNLPEKMPISGTNVIKVTIYPPRLAKNVQGIGNVVTSNYTYFVSVGYKFSALTRTHLQQEDNQLKSKYILPISQMDTNAAYQLATQFLSAASMDFAALNRDCKVHISVAMAGQDEDHFVPLYFISWVEKGKEGRLDNAASVELFLPTKSLRQLHVNKSEYILCRPLRITNPDFLSLPTNGPPRQFRNFGLPPPQ